MNLRKSLAKKLKKTGGFTLVEMLIVVAIIAILVAVSIPMVNSSLNKARTATDDANERAAKGAALVTFMGTEPVPSTAKVYCYDAANGIAKEQLSGSCVGVGGATGIESYGQGSKDGSTTRSGHVHVTIDPTKTDTEMTKIEWSGSGS